MALAAALLLLLPFRAKRPQKHLFPRGEHGLPVLPGRLVARSAETSSPYDVPAAGYRGVAVSLVGDQAAFLKKGDRVDALVTFENKGVVELVVNPNEAQYLALSLQQGTLYLTVRAPKDTNMTPMEMASFRKLFK